MQDARQTLRAFIEAAEGGYALCLCNSPAERDRIVADLSHELAGLNIGLFRLRLQHSAPSIAGALRLALDANDFREYSGRVAKVAISVEDIDETIPTEYRDLSVRPPTLQGMNQQRDWLNKLGRPLLLWFPEWLMSRLREVAPDLWAGRAVVVEFETLGGLAQFQQAYLAARWSPVQSADEARRRIRIYQDLMKGKLDPARRAELLVFVGNLHEGLGEWDAALQEHEQALAAYLTLGDKQGEALALGNIGLVWYDKGEWDKALEFFEKGMKIQGEIGDRQGVALKLGNIGLVWQAKGEWDNALEFHGRALKLAEEPDDRRVQAINLGNIGNVLQDKGEWDKALEFHEKALGLDRELGNKQGEATALGNIGVVWMDKGEWDRALEYHKEALKLHRELGDKEGEARQLGNIGNIHTHKGEWDKAVGLHVRARALFAQLGAPHERGTAEGDLADCLKAMGKEKFIAACEKAGMKREEAEKLAETLGQAKAEGQ
ncbi:MAG: tetratricopeptide repeat protein [candidate division WOR-3 bacterium]|nr:tetratricopeptide repeat protein [candidate division WOR-3 bacterium]